MTEPIREERGPKSPAEPLAGAIELLERLREGIGFSAASRETMAEALGYGGLSGTSTRKLAALNHYDLVERVGGSSYRISDLGKRILVPRDDREHQEAIAEAAKRPNLFQRLWERFAGHALPTLLPNILVREFGVLPQSSEDVARIFRETAEFAGLLRQGVLYDEPEGGVTPPPPEEGRDGRSRAQTRESDPQPEAGPLAGRDGAVQRYTIALDRSGRVAALTIPLPISRSDLTKVAAWLRYMESVAEDDKEAPVTEGSEP